MSSIAQSICQPVPHRQSVWTIPKRLRIFFRFDRGLLGGLARAAWETIVEVFRFVLGRNDVLPGAIAGVQTFGDLIHFHPHVHVIATDGAYTPNGGFMYLGPMDTNRLLSVWQRKVFELLLAEEKIEQELVDQMRGWPHSGFSVDHSVYLPAGDASGLQRLAEYMVCCPFSLARIVRVTKSGSVVYRAQKGDCRRFPTPAIRDLAGGASHNFQVFDAIDFLAELTQHIPDKGEHLVRYFGWYSYRRRGIRAKEASSDAVKIDRRLVDEARSAAKGQSSGKASSWAGRTGARLIGGCYPLGPRHVVFFSALHRKNIFFEQCGAGTSPSWTTVTGCQIVISQFNLRLKHGIVGGKNEMLIIL